jgi:hypothetical protein
LLFSKSKIAAIADEVEEPSYTIRDSEEDDDFDGVVNMDNEDLSMTWSDFSKNSIRK